MRIIRLYTCFGVAFLCLLNPAYSKEKAGDADQVVSDQWYIVTVKKKIPYSYYNEHVELKKGRVYFKNDVWKKEEGYINRESLGAFAENNDNLVPLFYNFHSTFRTTETAIDGTVQDGKMLNVKIHRGSEDLPVVKKGLPSKAIFSVFFPIWVQRNIATIKEGRTAQFTAIMEDDLEHEFMTLEGRVKLDKQDELATKTKTTKLLLDYRGEKTSWWIDSQGRVERIEMPTQDVVVERTNKAKAIKFLD